MNLRRFALVALALVAAFALQFQLYRANRWLDAHLRPAPHAVHTRPDGRHSHGPRVHDHGPHRDGPHRPDRHRR